MSIVYFYGNDCPQCKEAERLIKDMEQEGFVFEYLEVWGNKENLARGKECGIEECGGVPYFYNQETKSSLCGVPDDETFFGFVRGDIRE